MIGLVKNSNVNFKNNYATNTGGVFYIGANDYVYLGDTFSHRKCFLNIPVDRSQIKFEFVNNSDGLGGDIIYIYIYIYIVSGAHEPPEGRQGASNYVQRHLILSGSDTFLLWTFPQVGNLPLWSLPLFHARDANSRIVNITRGPRIQDGTARARR